VPTYHYRCKNCGHDFTQVQSFTDDALTICPNCGKPQLRKVYSAVPISFKGHGFYRTDMRGSSQTGGKTK
jgi:putative FmdB family regulatory protein